MPPRPARRSIRRPSQVRQCAFLHAATSREGGQHNNNATSLSLSPRFSAPLASLATSRLLIALHHGRHRLAYEMRSCSEAALLYNTTTQSRQLSFTASQLSTHISCISCISWSRIDITGHRISNYGEGSKEQKWVWLPTHWRNTCQGPIAAEICCPKGDPREISTPAGRRRCTESLSTQPSDEAIFCRRSERRSSC